MGNRGSFLAGLNGWRLWTGVGLGALFWALDWSLRVAFARPAGALPGVFSLDSPDIWIRLLVFLLCAALGYQAQRTARTRAADQRREEEARQRLEAVNSARQAAAAAEEERLRGEIRKLELAELHSRDHVERLESILGAARIGVSITGPGFALRFVDPALAGAHGNPQGRTCHDYFMGRPEPCPGCPAEEVRRTGRAVVAETVLPREGSRPVQVRHVPLDGAGENLQAQVWSDISGQRQAEEALRQALGCFLAGPVVAFTRRGLPDWSVEWVSDNVSRFSYRPEDFLGGRARFSSLVHPEDLPRVTGALGEALRQGRSSVALGYRLLRPDGAAQWVYDTTVPERDAEGRVVRLHSFLQDAESLAESQGEPRRHASGAQSAEGLPQSLLWAAALLLDRDGTILQCNQLAEELLGHPARDLAGRDLAGLAATPEEGEAVRRAVARSRGPGPAPAPSRHVLAGPDGSPREVILALAGVRHPTGLLALVHGCGDAAPGPASEASWEGARVAPAGGMAEQLPPLPPLRILLAEDNQPSSEALAYFLGKAGLQVTCAADGREALDCLAREPFDLVLMDVQMPGMDGVEAVRRIRCDTSGAFDPAIPVIALTAYALDGNREEFLAEGMDDYVSKPINLQALFAALARQCRPDGAGGDVEEDAGLREEFAGDEALYRAAVSLVLAEAPERLDGLRRSLAAGDLAVAQGRVGILAATLDLLPAPELSEAVQAVDRALDAADSAGAGAALEELEAVQARHLARLARSLAGPDAPRPGGGEVAP